MAVVATGMIMMVLHLLSNPVSGSASWREGRTVGALSWRSDVDLLQHIMAVHKADIFKGCIKQPNTMMRNIQSGVLQLTYEQINCKGFDPEGKFKGRYRPGRCYAKNGGSLQGMRRVICNTLTHNFYYGIDTTNAHPNFAAQLFGHLPTPTYLAYANNRQHFIDQFTSATGLGAGLGKQIVASTVNGSSQYGLQHGNQWHEMWSNPKIVEGL